MQRPAFTSESVYSREEEEEISLTMVVSDNGILYGQKITIICFISLNEALFK